MNVRTEPYEEAIKTAEDARTEPCEVAIESDVKSNVKTELYE